MWFNPIGDQQFLEDVWVCPWTQLRLTLCWEKGLIFNPRSVWPQRPCPQPFMASICWHTWSSVSQVTCTWGLGHFLLHSPLPWPLSLKERGPLSLGTRKSKQSPCSYGEARTIWPTASAIGDLASRVLPLQVGSSGLLFIFLMEISLGKWWRKPAQGLFYLHSLACKHLVCDIYKGLSPSCAFLSFFF